MQLFGETLRLSTCLWNREGLYWMRIYRNYMTQDQLRRMIAYHESALARVKAILDRHYYELEDLGEEKRWFEEYKKQEQVLLWLKSQIPDNV